MNVLRLLRPAAVLSILLLPAAGAIAQDQTPGQKFHVKPSDLPKPFATPSKSNSPEIVERPADAKLSVPPGFSVNIFAEGLRNPRWMVVASNGDVLVAESRADRIVLLRDVDGDGKAELKSVFAPGFDQPHGLAIKGEFLYVADVQRVWRLAYKPGQTKANGHHRAVTSPGALGPGTGHWTRNVVFHPNGTRFYVAIGSENNIAVEPRPRATVQEFEIGGSGQKTFAAGLRNPVGIAFYPGTNDLYVVVNERDGMGDGLVPDYLTRVKRGGFYGWPYAYIGTNPQPGLEPQRPELVKKTIVPDVLFQSHSAPIGLVFYAGTQFPASYRGDAFVALRGSWNSSKPTGYKVVRVPFKDRRPVGGYENFATGFWTSGAATAQVWGRPAGLAVARDGSLLIADDVGGVVWRISYGKK